MSPVNVKGRRKVINFYLYPICISNQQILLQLCVELQSELAQAVAPLPTGFSAADACTFFLSKTTQNVPKSLPLLSPCFGSAIVVKPIGGNGFSCGSPPKVLKSNIPSPFGCCCCCCCHCCCCCCFCCCCCCCCHCCCCCCCCCCCGLQCLRLSCDNDAIGGRVHPFRFTIETNACFASVDFHCFRDLPFQRFSECLGYSELKS